MWRERETYQNLTHLASPYLDTINYLYKNNTYAQLHHYTPCMLPYTKQLGGVYFFHLIVLGSEKVRLMERKMKNEILGSAYFLAETLQNELCLMKIGQSSQKIRSLEVESQHST